MKIWYTGKSIIAFGICTAIASNFARFILSETSIARNRFWRKQISKAIIFNIVGFVTVTLLFINIYNFITDDVNYFYMPSYYVQPPFSEVTSPIQFMWYITWPFKHFLGADIQSMHVLFWMSGLIGSLLLFATYAKNHDLTEKKNLKLYTIAFWALLCFPNFIAWGRFYGKDSFVFTWGAVIVYHSRILLKEERKYLGSGMWIAIASFLIYQIRPHIVAAFITSLMTALTARYLFGRVNKRKKNASPMRILIPMIAPAILVTVLAAALSNLTGSEAPSAKATAQKLVSSYEMGSFGGSETEFSAGSEKEEMIYNPIVIFENLFNLYFAPMPWQIGGVYQIVALISNVLLFVALVSYWKNIRLDDPFSWFLIMNIILLSAILSFMTGNVGLIMRQKIILLPSIFLLLFATKRHHRILSR